MNFLVHNMVGLVSCRHSFALLAPSGHGGSARPLMPLLCVQVHNCQLGKGFKVQQKHPPNLASRQVLPWSFGPAICAPLYGAVPPSRR